MSLFSHDDYGDEPVATQDLVRIPKSLLLEVESALRSGLEAAREAHERAVVEYGARKPIRIGWYAKEVEKIEGVLRALHETLPCVLPALEGSRD